MALARQRADGLRLPPPGRLRRPRSRVGVLLRARRTIADCGVAPNVQVDGVPTDEWICRFALDAGNVVYARCTETLPGERTCVDVEQDAYRTGAPRAMSCHTPPGDTVAEAGVIRGLQICSTPGGGVYACESSQLADGDQVTLPVIRRCERRIFATATTPSGTNCGDEPVDQGTGPRRA